MKFTTDRESLLRPLQLVTGVVERRQTLPVLSNLLVRAADGVVSFTGTDLEVQMVASIDGIEVEQEGSATIPARKLADIWRSLVEGSKVSVAVEGTRTIVRSGRSRFALATLPVDEFPDVASQDADVTVSLPLADLQRLLDKTSFAMAQQDVRYFLNGMLLEITSAHVRAVATDGHRMAMCTVEQNVAGVDRVQVIVPRKGVIELGRLLNDSSADVVLSLGRNHLTVKQDAYTLTTKLVDGKFPDYETVRPKETGRTLVGDRETLRHAFQRAAILSNEKYRCVRLSLEGDQMKIEANNPEQEEAEEIVAIEYDGDSLEIGFNVAYLQDVLGVIDTESVRLSVADANSSALIEAPGVDDSLYVVMPMRL
ncbi:MAG: DNA polymerase III subunit beta [Pseudomonadota bacterium]|nr:DNA polymerase III subunit beta [Pseudomonadota bacterium]